MRGEVFATCKVLEERADGEGAFLRILGEPEAVKRLKKQVTNFSSKFSRFRCGRL